MGCELMAAALGRSRYRLSVAGYSTESGGFRSIIEQSAVNIDVAVISAGLKDGPLAGFRLARELRVSHPGARIIALLDSSERSVVVEAFRSGASGILSREQPFETMCKCIHAVYQGQVWASSREMQYAIDALAQNETVSITKYNKSRTVLTKREEGVVRLVSEGFTNRDISQELKLSENTVRNYLFRIFNKVGASNRLELALYVLNRKTNERQEAQELDDSAN
jgi:two-component system nitrate/nitrite response regulator NarL